MTVDRYNHQMVLLVTTEGTAMDEEQLKETWIRRLKDIAPHYTVEAVRVSKGMGEER